uniref:Uncharacterized protein n=1 Tax=Romanomermis culicivorax TaxID=13658 RepID=A0A915JVG6_ROMCU
MLRCVVVMQTAGQIGQKSLAANLFKFLINSVKRLSSTQQVVKSWRTIAALTVWFSEKLEIGLSRCSMTTTPSNTILRDRWTLERSHGFCLLACERKTSIKNSPQRSIYLPDGHVAGQLTAR